MLKRIGEIIGIIYACMVPISAFIMVKEELQHVDGIFSSWDVLVECLWHAGLWPLFLPAYLI